MTTSHTHLSPWANLYSKNQHVLKFEIVAVLNLVLLSNLKVFNIDGIYLYN